MRREKAEEFELFLGQRHFFAFMDDHVALGVDHQACSVVVSSDIARGLFSPQQRLNTRNEDTGLHGLQNVVVGSGFETSNLAVVLPARSEKCDNGLAQRLVFADLRARFHAIHFRHHHVEQDQIGQELFGQGNPFISIVGGVDVVSLFHQIVLDEIQDVWFVVHKENALFSHGSKFILGMFS